MAEAKPCDCAEKMRESYRSRGLINPRCDVEPPRRCPVNPTRVHTMCRKCTEVIAIEFGAIENRAEARALLKQHDFPRECPGWHVELSGWDWRWQFEACIIARFGE